MNRLSLTALMTIASVALALPFMAQAQTLSPEAPFSITPTSPLNLQIQNSAAQAGNLNRAKNLARQTAEKANGGLGFYRAEASMHGPAAEAPFVDNGDGTFTFAFLGGKPGFTTPSVQSVITVNTTDWSIRMDYNGAIRTSTMTPATPYQAVPSQAVPR